MRTNETLNGVLSFNNHNHPFSLVKLKQTYYYFQFCKSNEFFDERRSAVFVLPLNKEHQLRSGEGGQEVHDHTSCIYVLSSLQRVSDMMLGCLESLTCLITLNDLHFPQADSLCVYMVIQRTLCGFTCSHLIAGKGFCLPWRPLMNQWAK